jgi:metal-sulfur cluster biosynthetic enzyme
MCIYTDHLEWHIDVYWRCVLRQCAATLITLNNILMSIGCVYYINVPQHWSPWMTSWCLLEVCTPSMCSNIDHLEWNLDVYWRCVLRQCAVTLITLNYTLMSIGGVYYINVQQHWSPWMTSWCLLEVCTTSMCSNIDHLEWHLDVYWMVRTTTMCSNTDHLEWYLDFYCRVCTRSMCSNTDDVEWLLDVYWRVRTTTMCSNTDHLEWYLDVYWRCVLRHCAVTLITLNDILMSIGGV